MITQRQAIVARDALSAVFWDGLEYDVVDVHSDDTCTLERWQRRVRKPFAEIEPTRLTKELESRS